MRVAPRHQLSLLALALVGTWATALGVAGDAVVFHHPPLLLRVLAAAISVIGVAAALRGAAHLVATIATGRRLADGVMRVARRDDTLGDRVFVVPSARPLAACVGLLRPVIVISDGVRAQLTADELAAVVAHERHHVTRRDPLREALLGALREACGRRGPVARLVEKDRLRREIDADHCATVRGPGRSALASALLTADEWTDHGVESPRVDRLVGLGVDLRPARRDLVNIALAAAILLATLVGLLVATGCVSGPDCAGHVHPAVVAGIACASALILLRPTGTATT